MSMYTMRDIIPLLGLPAPNPNRSDYNVPCPCCDTGRRKHLNIHLGKNVFRCPRCDFSGGVFDLYAHMTGIDRQKVRDELNKRLHGQYPADYPKKQISSDKKADDDSEAEVIGYTPTDINSRDETYNNLLSLLPLAKDHEENLLARGLSMDDIHRFGYRSTPMFGHELLAKKLLSKGCYLAGVPGFHRNDDGEWTLLQSKRGIIIPSRDVNGQIQGLKVRLDNAKRRKFRWMSTKTYHDGCGCESWVHIAGPVRDEILLTEGEMKADIIHQLSGASVIGIPGANALVHLREVLLYYRERGMKRIMTAFDMDYLNRWTVQKGYSNLLLMLEELDIEFGTYLWLPLYNGLDDYIWKYEMECCLAA